MSSAHSLADFRIWQGEFEGGGTKICFVLISSFLNQPGLTKLHNSYHDFEPLKFQSSVKGVCACVNTSPAEASGKFTAPL